MHLRRGLALVGGWGRRGGSLLHEDAGYVGRGSVVEILLEESLDFFHQVGRVVQAVELEALETGDRCVLEIFPGR